MYRAPARQPSPGAPRPAGTYRSPPGAFHGARSPSFGPRYAGSRQYGCSPGGSPGSPAAFSHRAYSDSPAGFGSRGYGDSPAGFGGRSYGDSPAGFGSRGYGGSGGKTRRRPDGFRRSHGADRADAVERYFSPAMLQDPWAGLRPVEVVHLVSHQYTERTFILENKLCMPLFCFLL
uniref:M-phase specific PLK1 interacting protein n=1 Tax=Myripristis murdjan TaxID=586833 RepID=A0A667XJX6_9TELE